MANEASMAGNVVQLDPMAPPEVIDAVRRTIAALPADELLSTVQWTAGTLQTLQRRLKPKVGDHLNIMRLKGGLALVRRELQRRGLPDPTLPPRRPAGDGDGPDRPIGDRRRNRGQER